MPMYHQVAVHFADLHDTPGRMEAVEVISVSIFYCCLLFNNEVLLCEAAKFVITGTFKFL